MWPNGRFLLLQGKQVEERRQAELEFRNSEQTKADLAFLQETVEPLKQFRLDELETIFGAAPVLVNRLVLPEDHFVSPIVGFEGQTVSGHQGAGKAISAFFSLGDLGGICVIQYEKRDTISAATLYLKRDHSYQDDRRWDTGVAGMEAAREQERPELEKLKAGIERLLLASPAKTP